MIRVETTGNFMLHDILGGQTISHEGITEVNETHLVHLALADGRLRNVDAPAEDATSDDAAPTSGKGAKGGKSKPEQKAE